MRLLVIVAVSELVACATTANHELTPLWLQGNPGTLAYFEGTICQTQRLLHDAQQHSNFKIKGCADVNWDAVQLLQAHRPGEHLAKVRIVGTSTSGWVDAELLVPKVPINTKIFCFLNDSDESSPEIGLREHENSTPEVGVAKPVNAKIVQIDWQSGISGRYSYRYKIQILDGAKRGLVGWFEQIKECSPAEAPNEGIWF